jgi:ABC-type bacteriocin/lantibiotic exporter with double-glycine peptidase domain
MNDRDRTAGTGGAPDRGAPTQSAKGRVKLPESMLRYVFEASRFHQIFLLALTVAVFLIELVPLELQRRIVNDLVKHREYRFVILLCSLYAAVAIAHGGTKLALNVYRGWVGERATLDLRRRVRALVGESPDEANAPETQGVQVSMIVAEVEPVGAFVGSAVSEPLLQSGVMLSVLAYMIHLDPWMGLTAFAIFVPQLVFVPLLQKAIIQRTGARVQVLRGLSVSIVASADTQHRRGPVDDARINRVFELDMGIFKLKFTMNFLMNLCNHLQIVAALLLGGWYVLAGQLEIGGVVAFISAVGRLNDPWGDLVNYFRDFSVNQVKYRLVATAVNQLAEGQALAAVSE